MINKTDKKKILVTGGNSMLAIYLSRVLGPAVVLIDKKNFDIRKPESLERILDEEEWAAVINTAGTYGGQRYDLFDIHAFSAAGIAAQCFKKQIPFAFISTARVFDGVKKEAPYFESDQPNPLDDYGMSKYLGERFIENDSIGMPFYIFRLPMLLGERLTGKERQIIYRLIDLGMENKAVKVAGDVYHSPVTTLYAAETISRIIQSKQPSGVYHISANSSATLYDIVDRTFRSLGISTVIEKVSQDYFDIDTPFPRNMTLASDKISAGPLWEKAVDCFVDEIASYYNHQ